MTTPELRPYQQALLGSVATAAADGHRGILIVAPTGSGKTVMVAAAIHGAVLDGKRVLFLAHRRELVKQAAAKLFAVGIDAGIIQAGFTPRPQQPVQIASVQTLYARAVRTSTMGLPDADLIVVDECHHIRARTYERILAEYPNAVVIGLTATPCRGDGRGLGTVFDVLVECPDVRELIGLGFLVPSKIYAPSRPDLTGVGIQAGDYVENQLATRMNTRELVGGIVEHWLRLAERRRTIVFAVNVAHSVHLRDEFSRAGVLCEHLDGSTPAEERDAILKRLSSGETEVVVNCMVLTEGFDCPAVGCIVLARPTKSPGLYRQMGGRGLRPAPGKKDVILLDHSGAVFEHGFLDDPVAWTLQEDKRAENKAHASRGQHSGMPRLVTCPECAGVRFEGKPCSLCGWRPRPKAQDFETIDGNLGEVRRDRSVGVVPGLYKERFFAMLLWIAKERGYQRGWAAHKYREKFGDWPPRGYVEAIPPDGACRRWVHSKIIAFAKAKQKPAAAA